MKLLVWDFDGTLGYRDQRWSGAFCDLLQEEVPDFRFAPDHLSAALQTGFPWHTPEFAHTHVSDADAWWSMLTPSFEKTLGALGLDSGRARSLSQKVRTHYCAKHRWHLFADSIEALTKLSDLGWQHVMLSNHVPELPLILEDLGIREKFIKIVNSAVSGYEKPHPRSYMTAIEGISEVRDLWMIGDSVQADFEGAKRVGWKAILVRQEVGAQPAFLTLGEVVAFLEKEPILM